MSARAVRRDRDRLAALSSGRRAQITSGAVQAVLHEGEHFDHCIEVSTTGALGKVYLSRQNLVELRRMIDAAEEACDRLDDRHDRWVRPPQRLVF